MSLKQGDFVVLSQEAVKNFYAREERIEDYCVGCNPDNLKTADFVDFVNSHLGFESGEAVGFVSDIRNADFVRNDATVTVIYELLTGGTGFGYYALNDLIKVKTK